MRNPLGNIHKHKITLGGKRVTVFDASKRSAGRKLFRRCYSYAEAQAALADFQSEPNVFQHTFAELVDYYKKTYLKKAVYRDGQKIAGFKRNLKYLEGLLDWANSYFGAMDLRGITHAHIYTLKIDFSVQPTRRGTPPSVSTINERLSVLRRLFYVAQQKGWIDVNPFRQGDALIKRSAETRRNRMLTMEEEASLLAACLPHEQIIPYQRTWKGKVQQVEQRTFVDRSHLIPLIICALDTAMRRSDLFNLTWDRVDLDRRVIYIEADAAKSKTGKPGILPMTERLHDVLERIYASHRDDDFVFPRFEYKRAFKSACDEAKIEDFQFRDLRSTGTTRMLLAGGSLPQVMKITRHTRAATFLEHYTNVDIGSAQHIGGLLDRFLKTSSNGSPNEKIKPLIKAA
jgi:integrase